MERKSLLWRAARGEADGIFFCRVVPRRQHEYVSRVSERHWCNSISRCPFLCLSNHPVASPWLYPRYQVTRRCHLSPRLPPPLHPSSSPSNPPVGPYQSTWWPTKPPHPGPDSTNIRQKENQGRHHSPSLSPHEIARLPLVQLPLVLAFFFGGTTQPSQLTGRPVTPLRRRRDSRTQLSIRLISRYVWGRERERKKEREKERERGSSALCSAGPSTRVNPSTLTSLEKSSSPFFSHQWCFNIPIRTAVSNWCSGLCSFSDQPNDTPNRLLWKL